MVIDLNRYLSMWIWILWKVTQKNTVMWPKGSNLEVAIQDATLRKKCFFLPCQKCQKEDVLTQNDFILRFKVACSDSLAAMDLNWYFEHVNLNSCPLSCGQTNGIQRQTQSRKLVVWRFKVSKRSPWAPNLLAQSWRFFAIHCFFSVVLRWLERRVLIWKSVLPF